MRRWWLFGARRGGTLDDAPEHGFDDRLILEEFRKPREARLLRLEEHLRVEARIILRSWASLGKIDG